MKMDPSLHLVSDKTSATAFTSEAASSAWEAGGSGDPPDPDQAGFSGTVYLVQVCKEHDPDSRRSMPVPRPPGSVPIGERARGDSEVRAAVAKSRLLEGRLLQSGYSPPGFVGIVRATPSRFPDLRRPAPKESR
jgi:hypothetical protein